MPSNDKVSGEFDDSHPIPKTEIKREWKKEYPNRAMPKIEGYIVPEQDFKRTVSYNRRYGSREGELKEYGRHLPLNKITGTLIKDEDTNTYLILRRSNATGPVARTVRHEMHHIAEKEGYGKTVHSKIYSSPKKRVSDDFDLGNMFTGSSSLFGRSKSKRGSFF